MSALDDGEPIVVVRAVYSSPEGLLQCCWLRLGQLNDNCIIITHVPRAGFEPATYRLEVCHSFR